jgi:hypothetical protein
VVWRFWEHELRSFKALEETTIRVTRKLLLRIDEVRNT